MEQVWVTEENISSRLSNVSKGLDKVWGLRDHSIFPEMEQTVEDEPEKLKFRIHSLKVITKGLKQI